MRYVILPTRELLACSKHVALSSCGPTQTLPGKRKPRTLVLDEEPLIAASSNDTVIDVQDPSSKPLDVKELLSIPVLRAVFASSSALGFAGSCFNNVFVLMAYTPLNQGGLALSVRPLLSRRPLDPSIADC